jgi:hypothetical protein
MMGIKKRILLAQDHEDPSFLVLLLTSYATTDDSDLLAASSGWLNKKKIN